MQPRLIKNIAENEVVEFNESVHVQGSIGKNAKVTIKSGSLKVDGAVESGADIDVQNGSADIKTANGPGTKIRASGRISVMFRNGDVKLTGVSTSVMFDNSNIKGTVISSGVTIFRDGVRTENECPPMLHAVSVSLRESHDSDDDPSSPSSSSSSSSSDSDDNRAMSVRNWFRR